MKIMFKKLLGFYIAILLVLGCSFTTYANEVSPMTGDKATNCNLSFRVTDESNSFSGKIKVVMKDVTGTSNQEYTLTKGNSWGGNNIPKFTVPAPTTYNLSFEGITDEYKLVNMDGSEITKFAATESGYDFKWKIISTASGNLIEEKTTSNNSSADTNNSSISGVTTESNNTGNNANSISISGNIKTGNEEADKVFNEFVNTVKFIETDPKWSDGVLSFMYEYERGADTGNENLSYAQDFADFVKGGTKEKYMAMSLFDRFVYEETYVRLAKYVSWGRWEHYFGSEKNFQQNVTNLHATIMKGYDRSNTVVPDAYLKLMKWQYAYIQEHKAPYDFVTGLNYLEVTGEEIDPEQEIKDREKENEKDIENVRKEAGVKKGIWDEALDGIAENAISIVLIIIIIIAVGIIVYIRKKNNINDDTQIK